MQEMNPDLVQVESAHFIGGRYIAGAAAGRDVLDVRRPSDDRVYAGLPVADAELVNRAVQDAWSAFQRSDWARQPPRLRARVLRRWAELVEADAALLAPLEAVGSTRPVRDVLRWDIPYTADLLRFYSELADKHGGEVAATGGASLGMTIAEPYGVIGAIAPWNFPLVMAATKIAPALAAGNAVVLKPSELTPFSALRLAELALAAGMPPGIFNVIQGDGRVAGDALVRHPRIAKVTFTGSTRTGASIMAACAESGTKPVTLELGGKSPQVVFADAPDLDRVARLVADGITGNAGQVCVSGSRLIVARGVAERVIEGVAAAFAALKPGATWDSAATLSPIIRPADARRIDGMVRRTVEAGARVACGGQLLQVVGGGGYYAPTILTGVDADMEAARDEVFGPVLTVQVFDDEAEAMALADHAAYGLAAGLHTADVSRALRCARQLEAGTVWINRYGRSNDFVMATGGYKRSGIGKDLGREAFDANLRHKSVLIDIASAD
ncbi:aldehyde dehydrogenase family protein [Rugamonas sp. FT82W]|uniref:Aldehyde dehydrogenase family protein n=1 Tax=Duganella vulcania TaxID=2692166 RepID=A0A845GAC6_9BURK|nr:aldehyde dehydrogenase family protein [Duganella vulcania]MYM91224.1 aldehyde dehydrogenase family protein [Duganella vulcania]